jgi:hypothetical protein
MDLPPHLYDFSIGTPVYILSSHVRFCESMSLTLNRDVLVPVKSISNRSISHLYQVALNYYEGLYESSLVVELPIPVQYVPGYKGFVGRTSLEYLPEEICLTVPLGHCIPEGLYNYYVSNLDLSDLPLHLSGISGTLLRSLALLYNRRGCIH